MGGPAGSYKVLRICRAGKARTSQNRDRDHPDPKIEIDFGCDFANRARLIYFRGRQIDLDFDFRFFKFSPMFLREFVAKAFSYYFSGPGLNFFLKFSASVQSSRYRSGLATAQFQVNPG